MGILTLNGNRIVLNGATISLFGPDRVAEAAGALALDGVAAANAPAQGQASGTLALEGSAAGIAPVRGQAAGALELTGVAVAVAPPLPDYSTGRLAFASQSPRAGRILNTAVRTGRVLNPVRRGTIMEIS